MSFDALAWAAKVRTKHSTDKLVLLGLAENASREAAEAWPSIAALCEFGSLNRKTVIAALDRLIESGLIFETGHCVGRTGQVKVYRLALPNNTENGTVKESQNRDRSQKRNSSVFTRKESQKRDTEPIRNHLDKPKGSSKARTSEKFILPSIIPKVEWEAFVEMRKTKAPMTDYAKRRMIDKLLRFAAAGHNIATVLDNSTLNGWRDCYEPKGQPQSANVMPLLRAAR